MFGVQSGVLGVQLGCVGVVGPRTAFGVQLGCMGVIGAYFGL